MNKQGSRQYNVKFSNRLNNSKISRISVSERTHRKVQYQSFKPSSVSKTKRLVSREKSSSKHGGGFKSLKSTNKIQSRLDIGLTWDSLRTELGSEYHVQVRRPDDFLIFELIFMNLQLTDDIPPKLVKQNGDAPAYLVVEFPPQSFAEQAFLETGNLDSTNKEKEVTDKVCPQPNGEPTKVLFYLSGSAASNLISYQRLQLQSFHLRLLYVRQPRHHFHNEASLE